MLYVPGLGEDGTSHEKWSELKDLFEERGYQIKVAHMPSFASIADGAQVLLEEIEKRHFTDKNIKFHIVAKSMGGLSARKVLHKEKESLMNRVMSLSTISTPHRGSEIADLYLDKDRDWCFISKELARPLSSMIEKLGFGENGLTVAGRDLRTDNMAVFNKTIRDVKGILYFSFRYKIDCGGSLCDLERISWVDSFPTNPLSACWHNIIFEKSGEENDGLVSVKSATWGIPIDDPYEGEHFAETAEPSSAFSKYKNKEIWKEVFERVLDNLDKQKLSRPEWP